MTTTIDGLLNKRIHVEQPKKGFRIAIDTLFLAAAVPAIQGDFVLDMGCGVGGAMLALAARVPGVKIDGIEIQPEMVELCRKNIERNGFQDRLAVEEGKCEEGNGKIGFYDYVMINPPFHDAKRHDASPLQGKATANTDEEGDLAAWIETAKRALKPAGKLVLIHRGDRRKEILRILMENAGSTRILPLQTGGERQMKRILYLIEFNNDVDQVEVAPIQIQDGNNYTNIARYILWEAGGISWGN